jgi:hypothetical protein
MLSRPDKALATALRRAGSGDSTAALRILDELIAHNPYNLDARVRRALLRYHTARYQAALEDAAVVLQIHPDDDDALALSGDCHLGLNRRQDAITNYSRALAGNPLNRHALAGLTSIAESADPPAEIGERTPPRSSDALPPNLGALLSPFGAAEEALLAYSLARGACPAVIVELGAADARLTIPLALALEHAGSGAVHSIGCFQTEFFGLEVEAAAVDPPSLLAAQETARAHGLDHRIAFHASSDEESVIAVFSRGDHQPVMVAARIDPRGGRAWGAFVSAIHSMPAGTLFLACEDGAARPGDSGAFIGDRLAQRPYSEMLPMVTLSRREWARVWVGTKQAIGPVQHTTESRGLLRRLLPRRLP